ncbi:MAG: RNA polymerase sigma factor [bacterium]|nr:RNA polymerase sigma factor [bacterium]
MNDPDLQLITAVAEGDSDAFEQLVRKYERRVFATIHRYVGNDAAVEDIAQEVFLQLWSKAKQFKRKSSFSTWLYRIVVNKCLNHREKRTRRRTQQLDEALPDNNPGTEQRYEKDTEAAIVRKAVDGLPKRQRMALLLSQFDGYSYKEISRIMKVSLSSVESLLFRARKGLLKELTPLRERGEI